VTTNEADLNFVRGKAILVINIFKLVNGKSIFGMRRPGENISIGSILIDDVHACLNTTEKQFTIEIERNDPKYDLIFSLFEEELYKQSNIKALEMKDGISEVDMLVPYWAWIDKNDDVLKILHNDRENAKILFSWPLLKDSLKFCNCVISTRKIEISPKSIPIRKITSFVDAKRRIFMSATLAEDSPLISHFDVNPKNIKTIITPHTAEDIGDRLILVPQEINPEITDDELKVKFKELSATYNTVVIVPSKHRAQYWEDVADKIFDSETIAEGVHALKAKHVGLVVFVNRYDGIDLPEEACRILVIDGFPDVRRSYDKLEHSILHGSRRLLNQCIQKIEQGMGRGVRSNTDYCVIFMMGRTLTNIIYADKALEKFSIATRKQIELSEEIAKQVRNRSIDDIISVANYCLTRNPDWVNASKSALYNIKYEKRGTIDPIILGIRDSFNLCQIGNYKEAANILNNLAHQQSDDYVKGWLLQQTAEYYHFIDKVESQNILKSALKYNVQIIKPIEGIQYDKKLKRYKAQGEQFIINMDERKLDENKFILKIKDLLDKLIFKPDTANIFEEALKEIGFYIGFTGRRPENEVGKGPDVLWRVGELEFLVIECKNGVTTDVISKHDCNQMNGSINWFKSLYDEVSCQQTPIIVHKGNVFEYSCSPDDRIRIMNECLLSKLKQNIEIFAKNVVQNGNYRNPANINKLLEACSLQRQEFVKNYTTKFIVKNAGI